MPSTKSTTRVLAYGAGVIGSVYAARLARAGIAVSMLARGERLVALHADGLRLHHVFLHEDEHVAVQVIDTLEGQPPFDLVLVTVRSDQVQVVLQDLVRSSQSGTIVVIGNNVRGHIAQAAIVGAHRFVLGFGAFGGVRDGSVIRYVDGRNPKRSGSALTARTTLGILTPEARPALEQVLLLPWFSPNVTRMPTN